MFEVKFVSSKAMARKLLALPECKDFCVIKSDLSIIMLRPKKIIHRYPRIVGMTILDIAKTLLYQGWDRIKATFNNRVRLAYTDTGNCNANQKMQYKKLLQSKRLFFNRFGDLHIPWHDRRDVRMLV